MPSVLLVDPSKSIREFCKLELQEAGYSLLSAADGRAALDHLRMNRVDIAVVDVHIDRGGCLEIVGQIVATGQVVPIIFLTSPRHDRVVKRGDEWLPIRCVQKREDTTELKQVIAELLRRFSSRRGRVQSERRLPEQCRGSTHEATASEITTPAPANRSA